MPVCRVALVAEDTRSPAAYAADIDAARERTIAFVSGCSDEEWRTAPLDGDPRPVAVVVDHVAHAYEYLAGWMRQIVAGQRVEVNSDAVDAVNARHARDAVAVSKVEATEHLRRSGVAISLRSRASALPTWQPTTAESGVWRRSRPGTQTIIAPTSKRHWLREASGTADDAGYMPPALPGRRRHGYRRRRTSQRA